MLTRKAAEFNTWAWINYRELHECCMFHGHQTPDVPEWGNEEVRCAHIPRSSEKCQYRLLCAHMQSWKRKMLMTYILTLSTTAY